MKNYTVYLKTLDEHDCVYEVCLEADNFKVDEDILRFYKGLDVCAYFFNKDIYGMQEDL